MIKQNRKSYYAIIPANVRYDERLTPNAKLLYGEITALCNEKGFCWANNEYFSDLYKKSKISISKWINQLKKYEYISTELIYKNGTKEIEKRYIKITSPPIKENFNTPIRKVNDPIKENFNTPIKEKFKDNIKYTNNKINNNKNKQKELSPKQKYLNKKYLKLSNSLKEIIQTEKKINKQSSIHSWVKPIRLLIEKDLNVNNKKIESRIQRVEQALKWYKENAYKDQYTPIIESGNSLREKFSKLENAANRNKNYKNYKNVEDDDEYNEDKLSGVTTI